jgi:hypothetical protein
LYSAIDPNAQSALYSLENGDIYKFPNDYLQEGISKRFYAACFAMQGLLASGAINLKSFIKLDYNIIIKDSYKLADELLKQENED